MENAYDIHKGRSVSRDRIRLSRGAEYILFFPSVILDPNIVVATRREGGSVCLFACLFVTGEGEGEGSRCGCVRLGRCGVGDKAERGTWTFSMFFSFRHKSRKLTIQWPIDRFSCVVVRLSSTERFGP